jgi:ribosomal-protein-serine acetyltransferase
MSQYLIVNNHIHLELLNEVHGETVFNLIEANVDHLSLHLPWVKYMTSIDHFMNFIKVSKLKMDSGDEISCVIFYQDKIVGRIGLYQIDYNNNCASIGYWLGKEFQGHGIISQSAIALMKHAFDKLKLNRIELRCSTTNLKSQNIAERIGFVKEGILRQAEKHDDHFVDLLVYSYLKEDSLNLLT